jgi:hypothetical protein
MSSIIDPITNWFYPNIPRTSISHDYLITTTWNPNIAEWGEAGTGYKNQASTWWGEQFIDPQTGGRGGADTGGAHAEGGGGLWPRVPALVGVGGPSEEVMGTGTAQRATRSRSKSDSTTRSSKQCCSLSLSVAALLPNPSRCRSGLGERRRWR